MGDDGFGEDLLGEDLFGESGSAKADFAAGSASSYSDGTLAALPAPGDFLGFGEAPGPDELPADGDGDAGAFADLSHFVRLLSGSSTDSDWPAPMSPPALPTDTLLGGSGDSGGAVWNGDTIDFGEDGEDGDGGNSGEASIQWHAAEPEALPQQEPQPAPQPGPQIYAIAGVTDPGTPIEPSAEPDAFAGPSPDILAFI